ncbi:hypothetical protein BH10PSE19_BH10PSE19_21200 [soil metagenome]
MLDHTTATTQLLDDLNSIVITLFLVGLGTVSRYVKENKLVTVNA